MAGRGATGSDAAGGTGTPAVVSVPQFGQKRTVVEGLAAVLAKHNNSGLREAPVP